MDETEYKYDLFIGYSSSKCELARKVMQDLERRFNIKCCFADRDFVPGAEIVENITQFMGSSNKVLLLICNEFIKSGWCWYEQQEAFRKYIDEKRNCLIPVLLENVEVPTLLRNLTYIEYYNEADPIAKIHQAFLCKYESDSHSAGLRLAYNFTRFGQKHIALNFHQSPVSFYHDDFSDSKERLEFMENEKDIGMLQDYFDRAAKEGDVDLIQCILKNGQTKLTSGNIYNFCVYLPKEAFSCELVELVFQKRQNDITFADYKDSYRFACGRDIPCLVTKFNTLGCESLIDVYFVEKLICASPLISNAQDNTLLTILKNKEWKDDEKTSILDVAIQARQREVVRVLVTRIPTIPFDQYSKMILMMDEETCVEIFKKQGYRDKKLLCDALQIAVQVDMKNLTKEILKEGVTLKPSFINDTLSYEIVEVLIQQYPWCLEELRDIETNIRQTKCKRLLRNEIQKRMQLQMNGSGSE